MKRGRKVYLVDLVRLVCLVLLQVNPINETNQIDQRGRKDQASPVMFAKRNGIQSDNNQGVSGANGFSRSIRRHTTRLKGQVKRFAIEFMNQVASEAFVMEREYHA